MRLAVFDTNVVVSAGLKLGSIPYRLIMEYALAGQIQIVVCASVISEYREVLWRPKFTRHGFPPHWIDGLIEMSLKLPDPVEWPAVLPHSSDSVFLGLAHNAGAWLVTWNLKHFPKSALRGVTVISPAEYLAELEKGK